MDIGDLVQLQVRLDEMHGFDVHFPKLEDKYNQLTKDLVGLFGEIGEFANLVKKINIKIQKTDEYEFDIPNAEASLRGELVDSLIYIFRLSAILEVDLNSAVLEKIELNRTRYAKLRPG
jgi:NTP pyrophosphatase (non-canonical NTP hydrolase)